MSRADAPYPIFTGLDNRLLDNGYVWFGVENEDPQTDPIAIYADEAMTVPLAQPVRTKAGLLVDGDDPVNIFVPNAYSMRVRNFAGVEVLYVPSAYDLGQLLSGPGGAGGIGFLQSGSGAVARTMQDKGRDNVSIKDFGAVGDGVADDTTAINAALAVGGRISIPDGSYKITAALTIYGDTQLVGDGNAKIVWAGPTTGSILQDSSITTPTDVNLNITLQDFEIDGGDVVSGDSGQRAINFYRTGNVTIRGLAVHGVGGSAITWGLSMADTANVLVENCRVYDCRQGDAIQGVGRAITIRNNQVGKLGSTTSNFGDSGIALLYDFSATTNPSGGYSSDVEISGNTVIGNYNLAGTYTGIGQQIQTGIAFGPFTNGHAANIRVIGNTVYGCYLNLWAIVMDDVLVAQNNFGSHAATATGNTRFDGVTNLRVKDNMYPLRLTPTGADFCAILLVAQRNVYGASKFDSDVSRFEISGNAISSIQPNVTGIRATFEGVYTSPSYISKLNTGLIEANSFVNITTPISLAPQTGSNANVCNDVVVGRNKVDSSAARILMAGGITNQYSGSRLRDNSAPATIPPVTGSGAGGLKWFHAASGTYPNATSGAAVNLITLPSGNYAVQIAARLPDQNSGALAASATVHVNGTAARITADNGVAMVLALSGLIVQATQSAGGNADISFDLQYTL